MLETVHWLEVTFYEMLSW